MSAEVLLESTKGSGRPVLIFYSDLRYTSVGRAVFSAVGEDRQSLILRTSPVTMDNWKLLAGSISETVRANGVRHAHVVALGDTAIPAQQLYLSDMKGLRSMVLVDGVARLRSNELGRLAGMLDEYLPLGLPLRNQSGGLDSRSFLHRIRCPVLLVTTPLAGTFEKAESRALSAGLPTSWHADAEGKGFPDVIGLFVKDFLDVPSKCPVRG